MVGWHHRLNGHEFEQTPGDGDEQGGLVCCSPWGPKESDTPERLNSSSSPPNPEPIRPRYRPGTGPGLTDCPAPSLMLWRAMSTH